MPTTSADAGGDAGVDAAAPKDAAADAGPRHVRIFVPFPDCTDNDEDASGDAVVIEGCECVPQDTVCCADGTAFECGPVAWKSLDLGPCTPGAAEPVLQCRECTRGEAGCSCRAGATCAPGLVCLEDFCGMPVE